MNIDRLTILDPVGSKAGMDYYDIGLASGLAGAGIACMVCSNFERPTIDGAQFHTSKTFDENPDTKSVISLFRYLKSWLKSIWLAKRFSSYCIVHVFRFSFHNYLFFGIAHMVGLKLLVIVHDIEDFRREGGEFYKKAILNRMATAIFVHNDFSKRELLDGLVPNRPVFAIQQGGYEYLVDKAQSRADAKSKLRLSADKKYLLFFGQIKYPKGLDVLLEALGGLKEYENLELIIAGRTWGPSFDEYQEIIDKHDLNDKVIQMIRFITDEERNLLYTAADAVVLPYRKIYQSAVLLMSLSYSRICIVSDLEPNLLAIKNGQNGFTFDQGDADALQQSIREFMNMEAEEQMIMEQAASRTSEDLFNWNKIGLEYKQVFKEI